MSLLNFIMPTLNRIIFKLFNLILFCISLSLLFFFLSYSKSGVSILDWNFEVKSWQTIILYIKLPNYIGVWLSGFLLGVVGCLMQGLLRNPLADPGVIGVSSGASLVCVIILSLFPGLGLLSGLYFKLIFLILSFIGAIIVLLLLYAFYRVLSKFNSVVIILVGVSLNSLFGAISLFIISFSDNNTMRQIVSWSSGNSADISWPYLFFILSILIISLYFSAKLLSAMNILSLGEESAQACGVSVSSLFLQSILISGLVIAATVAIVGPIGFVGLISPHISRLIRGANHNKVMVTSGHIGAIIMIFSSYISNELLYPYIIPKGIIVSMIGVPFFLWILCRSYYSNKLL